MNERDALYRHICANPHDDTARLVFADWLQEHGDDARAEFIRIQCRLEEMTPDGPEYDALREREEELFLANRRRWFAEIPKVPGLPQPSSFSRGFPTSVTPSPKEGNRLRRAVGLIEVACRSFPADSLSLSGFSSVVLQPLFDRIDLPRFRGLSLNPVSGTVEEARFWRELVNSGRLRHLLQLDVRVPGSDGFRAMCDPRNLSGLRELALGWTLPSGELTPLVGSELAGGLRKFSFRGGSLSKQDIGALGACGFESLHSLELGSWGGRHMESLASILTKENLPRLRSFKLNHKIELDTIQALASHGGLRELHLASTVGMNLAVIRALIESEELQNLSVLKLDRTQIADQSLTELARKARFPRLREYSLVSAKLSDSLLQAFAKSEMLRNVRTLHLARDATTEITPEGTARFLSELNLPELRSLYLAYLPIEGEAAKVLSSRSEFGSLRQLRLWACQLNDEDVRRLIDAPHLQNLHSLDVTSNAIRTGLAGLANPSVMPNLDTCMAAGNPLAEASLSVLRDRFGASP